MFKTLKKDRKGFSLIEIIAVISLIVVLLAFITPSLLGYIEDTRAKRDTANMEEIIKAVQVAMVDYDTYNIIEKYATEVPAGYAASKSGVVAGWSSEKIRHGLTITFYSDKKDNPKEAKISIANAVVNKGVTELKDGHQVGNILLTNMSDSGNVGLLYKQIVQLVGEKITLDSKTYRNSNYTIFIVLGDEIDTTYIYGQWNGNDLIESDGLGDDDVVETPPDTDDHTHDFIVTGNTATCTTPGIATYQCSCGETKTEESPALGHNYNSVVTAPTCTEQGYTTHTCSRCGDSYVDSYIDALGHDWQWVIDTPATITTTGLKHEECSRCHIKRNENTIINKLVCTHSMTATAAKTATCTAAGNSAYWYCSNCGNYFSDSAGQNEIAINSWIIAALGHSYNSVVTNPTCTAQGYTTHTCTRCGHSYKDSYVDALGHDWQWVIDTPATITTTGLKHEECSRCHIKRNENTVIDKLTCTHSGAMTGTAAKSATCTEAGNSAYWYCSNCGKYFSDSAGQNEIAINSWIIAALGHNYNPVVTAPTCTAQGYTTHTCTRCGHSYKDSYVAASGHTEETLPAVAATCSATGLTAGKKCSVCGVVTVAQTVVAKKAHTRGTYYTIWPNCFDAGTQHCTCKVCGASYTQTGTKIGGHNYVAQEQTEAWYIEYKCNNDLDGRTSKVNTCGHTYREFIVTSETKYWDVIGYSDGDTELSIPSTFTANLDGETHTYTVVEIDYGAFLGCDISSITLPNTIRTIDDYAFAECSNLVYFDMGAGVKTIGKYAFENCTGLHVMVLPDSLTSIGDYAFNGCTGLESIIIPDSVLTIGESAFKNCTSAVSVTIGSNVTTIGKRAFQGCASLESVIIPGSVTTISEELFDGCTSLASITISNGVTSIEARAFSNTAITSITIPASVTSISSAMAYSTGSFKDAFSGCTSLTEIIVDDNNNTFADISGVLFNKDKTRLIRHPAGRAALNLNVTSGVSVNAYAFDGCTSLKKITIKDENTSINAYAFAYCSSVQTIVIADSVTTIGNYAFYNCTSLTSVTMPSGITTIGEGLFHCCSSLTSITIPDGVTSIGSLAFGESGLTNITIPSSVTSIGDMAFFACYDLTKITFNGTKAQWNAITKGSNWISDNGMGVTYTVYCSNGNITATKS